jgi:hypothetical protein
MFERLLFFLSMFLLLLIGSLSSLQPLCREDERSALLQFKEGILMIAAHGTGLTAVRTQVMWFTLTFLEVVSTVLSQFR